MEVTDEGLPIGTILNERYRIEREFGSGGMSHVYLSSDRWRKGHFAIIKTPYAKFLKDRWVIRKFKQEAESLARLKHPGIVELLGYGEFEKLIPFVILEFVEGITLREVISELPTQPKRAAKLFLQIAKAVDYAHSQQIFHRDLKPENIMIQYPEKEKEGIKLIDFGVARIEESFFITSTKTRYQVGTPHYISPNRLRHNPDDRADDIYALGLIIYEMLTGTNPLCQAGSYEELEQIQEQIRQPRYLQPELPKAVDREIVKALSLNPLNRHSSVIEFGTNIYEAFFVIEQKNKTDISHRLQEKVAFEITDEDNRLAAITQGEKYLITGDFESAITFYNLKIKENQRSDLYYSRRALAFLMKKIGRAVV